MQGTLSLDGPNTLLYLWSNSVLNINLSANKTITGILDDQRKVSCLECVIANEGSHGLGHNISYYVQVFPHYVITGHRHFADADNDISEISFVLDDIKTLFKDTDAFGIEFGPRWHSVLRQIIDSKNLNHAIDIGDHHLIAYYTGKGEIFSSDTVIGRISAHHAPSVRSGSSDGACIANEIFASIKFDEAINIIDAFSRMYAAVRFFELIVGRAQNFVEVNIYTTDQGPLGSAVYNSNYPRYQRSGRDVEPISYDMLIDAVRDPNVFASVLAAWVKRHIDKTWFTPRWMFFRGWSSRSYNPERMVSAANTFDLLSEEEFPNNAVLPGELALAVAEAKRIFRDLPQSMDRDNVLNALGRVGKWTLKKKIRHRSRPLLDCIEDKLPELPEVIDEAVNLRNLYVHGSPPRIRIDCSRVQSFLTDTLEFIFSASDLVEMGWDIASWCQASRHLNHPFGFYIDSYRKNLSELKMLLNAK